MTEKELKDYLDYFAEVVGNAKLTWDKKINFFSATKMLSLETKHSAFFAWLLDPKNEHCLGNAVLKKLMKKLFNYPIKIDKATNDKVDNSQILKDDRDHTELVIQNDLQLVDLANVKDIRVYTEKETYNKKRIDILIDIVDSETIIAIENKIDSDIHSDQLCEYESYVNAEYGQYKKKIFIFLTPSGKLPYNKDGNNAFNKEWCLLDYGAIRDIADELRNELNQNIYKMESKEQEKLLNILEDYIGMLDTNILHVSAPSRQECKRLLDNPKVKEAFDILTVYSQLPTAETISNYACNYLNGLRDGTTSKIWFYTKAMRDYYEIKHGEEYKIAKLRIVCMAENLPKGSTQEPKIVIYLNSERCGNKPFSPAQKALLMKCQGNADGTSPTLIPSITLVERNERGKLFDQLEQDLIKRLDKFKEKLSEFEKDYL